MITNMYFFRRCLANILQQKLIRLRSIKVRRTGKTATGKPAYILSYPFSQGTHMRIAGIFHTYSF